MKVQRAFQGLTGRPSEPDDTVVPTLIAAPEPPVPGKKLGRPPKAGGAVPDAERQRQSRARRIEQDEASERRALIRRIMRSYRSQISKPSSDNRKLVEDVKKNNKQWMRAQHKMLLTQPLDELRKLAGVQHVITDSTGRQGEVTGGQTNDKIERIDAAIQREERLGGTRGKVEGNTPDSYEKKDTTVDRADSIVLRRPKATTDVVLKEQYLEAAYELLIVNGGCVVCHQPATVDHLRKLLIAADKAEDILDALDQLALVPEQVRRDTVATINNPHVLAADEKIAQLHRDHLARGRMARKLERLGKKAKREFLEERDLRQEEQSKAEGWT
jgi:hypothetical protein